MRASQPHALRPRIPGPAHAVYLGRDLDTPGLDRRTRSLTTLAAMGALNRSEELHLHPALRNGVARDEIKEVLLQMAVC